MIKLDFSMKNMILILVMSLLFTGCKKDEQQIAIAGGQKEQESSIYGIWKLVESFSHPPTGKGWSQVENGYLLNIQTDGTFSSSQFSDCSTGKVTVATNQIILIYDCSRFSAGFESPTGVFKYSFELVNGKLELTPQNFNCFEGCKYRLAEV